MEKNYPRTRRPTTLIKNYTEFFDKWQYNYKDDTWFMKYDIKNRHKGKYKFKICLFCGTEYIGNHEQKFCKVSCIGHGKFNSYALPKVIEKIKHVRTVWTWKGGVTAKNLPLYDTYAPQLNWIDSCRRAKSDENLLEVQCSRQECNNWFIPKLKDVKNRRNSINIAGNDKHRFYCSEECKHKCPIYGKSVKSLIKYQQELARVAKGLIEDEIDRTSAYFKQNVLELDNFMCVKCESTENLQVHHEVPVSINPMLQNDIDNGLTLCKDCHLELHMNVEGCSFNKLKERASIRRLNANCN